MLKHEHVYRRVVANRPGVATIKCGCGKVTLVDYNDPYTLWKLEKDLRKIRKVRWVS